MNVPEYKTATANSDPCTILLEGASMTRAKYTKHEKRITTHQSKLAVTKAIAMEEWIPIVAAENVHLKALNFHAVVVSILDEHCSVKTAKGHHKKPSWMTSSTVIIIIIIMHEIIN